MYTVHGSQEEFKLVDEKRAREKEAAEELQRQLEKRRVERLIEEERLELEGQQMVRVRAARRLVYQPDPHPFACLACRKPQSRLRWRKKSAKRSVAVRKPSRSWWRPSRPTRSTRS